MTHDKNHQTAATWVGACIDNPKLEAIAQKIHTGERISVAEGLSLWQEASASLLAHLAMVVRKRLNGNNVYFNRNFHLEPTNQCVFQCEFCSYSTEPGQGGWDFSADEILAEVTRKAGDATEIHIVGGAHPGKDLGFYGKLLSDIKLLYPHLHIKAFTAVEIDYMAFRSGQTVSAVLSHLQASGLGSLPGGGAEIFDPAIRKKICPRKSTAAQWLQVHRTAHQIGLPTNATMLYGHLEDYHHRLEHMLLLRDLQDETGGFNTFIPLKFRNKNNRMSQIKETSLLEDLKTFAMARIFLDNIPHLKAYWPMLGIENATLSLHYGVDDLDGTINDSTRIYTMAGAQPDKTSLTTPELIQTIRANGFAPIERDSIYNTLKTH